MKSTYIKRHTPSEAVQRTRGWSLALLLLPIVAIAGCTEEEAPLLAQPTDEVPVPSQPTVAATPTAPVDFDDPGLVLNGTWQVGDEWDYSSNRSAVRQVRVVARYTQDGVPHFLVADRVDRPGQIPDVRRYVVNGVTWMKVNTTDDQGYTQEYDPGIPLRQNRNSTYFYNISLHGRTTPTVPIASVAATTRYPSNATLQYPWGFVEAARIEHRITVRPEGKDDLQRSIIVRYVAADFLNDVLFVEAEETWKLTAAQVGDFRRGQLLSG